MKARSLILGLVAAAAFETSVAESVHDPSTVVIENDGIPRFLSTGGGIKVMARTGGGGIVQTGRIFPTDGFPEWHAELVPGNRGHLWAPDVIRSGDRWWVYYSVSTFGRNVSAIGLVSGPTLDPESPDYAWKDEGVVIRSKTEDRFNAIDPALIRDGDRLWMSFGSFWDGIMLVELDPESGKLKNPDESPVQLANYPEIEAPFIHREDDWYYLFVNWGKCCRKEKSTYEIRVGRSRSIEGPYLDREGNGMTEGGGTLVLDSEGRFIGPGHASILEKDGERWLTHHFYDGEDDGRSKFRMLPLRWEDGWPVVGEGK